MKPGKNMLLILITYLILLVLYNIIVFSLVSDRQGSFWSAYAFTMIAFLVQIIAFLAIFKKDTKLEHVFLGIPLGYISFIYFALQLAAGAIIMAVPDFGLKSASIIQILILAAYAIVSIFSLIARSTVESVEQNTRVKVFYIKSLEADITALAGSVPDDVLKKKLVNLKDIIKYSDPMSHPSLDVLEQRISTKAAVLAEQIEERNYLGAGNLIGEIEKLFAERNSKCRLLK